MTKKRSILFITITLVLIIVPALIPFLAHVKMPFWSALIYMVIVLVNAAIFYLNYEFLIRKYLIQGKLWKFISVNFFLVFAGLGIQLLGALLFESFPTGTELQVSDVVDISVRIAEASIGILIEILVIIIAIAIVLSDGWNMASFRYNEAMIDKERLEGEREKLEEKIAGIEKEKQNLINKTSSSITRADSISVKVDLMMTKVFFDDILFIKSDGDYIIIHTADGKTLMTLMTMKNIEKQLPFERFCRVHRSYIVNMDKVSGIKERKIIISTHQIPLSDTCKAAFYELLSHKSLVLKSM